MAKTARQKRSYGGCTVDHFSADSALCTGGAPRAATLDASSDRGIRQFFGPPADGRLQ